VKYARLGQTGLTVSRICLGMMSFGKNRAWQLNADTATPLVRQAIDAGITFFDTADMYSDGASEEITGRLLSKFFPRREDYVLATKVYFPTGTGLNEKGLSRKHIMAAIDASLARLGTDYVDLYQIHRYDDSTPIEETMIALHDIVRAGKARYLGASSMYAWQFATAQHIAPTPFVSMQNHYNLMYREEEREMIPYCIDQGIGVIPYSPLARGRLVRTGHTTRTDTDPVSDMYNAHMDADEDVRDALHQLAEARNVPPAQAALAWLLHKPGVTAPIVGATKGKHVEDAAAAVDLTLTEQEIATLESPYQPHPILGHDQPDAARLGKS
jgi:1-deoxyxylulose-5-phosphate synthase